jgi:hypothetical protein
MPTVPESENVIRVENNAIGPQRVVVTTPNESVHQLFVGDASQEIAVRVDGVNLSVAAGAVIEANGALELANGGTVTGQAVTIQGGAALKGNGTVVGNLDVGTTGGPPAILSPGFSVGHLDVEGNYRQGSSGVYKLDLEKNQIGQFDTIHVTGEELGGTLVVDASAFTSTNWETTVTILTAGDGIAPGTTFDSVETLGSNFYFVATYLAGEVLLTDRPRGDMDGNNMIDADDIDDFVLALRNPDAYCNSHSVCGSQSGNMDGMNGLDFDDIDEFATALQNRGIPFAAAAIERAFAGVPEPGTMTLAVVGALGGFAICLQRRRGHACRSLNATSCQGGALRV